MLSTFKNFRLSRIFAISLLFLTGACALIYEVTWHRYLSNLIGSEAKAASIILAVFLGGLAIGYELFGRLSHGRSQSSLTKLTGWLEVGIGVWAILFTSFYDICWKVVGIWGGGGANLFSEILISSILILVPTILMGGTLPLLTQALSVDLKESKSIHAWIYSVNTAGSFLGCLAAGFWLLPRYGLPLTLLMTAPVNLFAGISFIGLGTTFSQKAQKDKDSKFKLEIKKELVPYFIVAFICGFIAITLQTALIRVLGLTVGSSEYAFSLVVAVFILMLALGSFRVARASESFFNRLWVNQLIVFMGLAFSYLTIPVWPYYSHVLRSLFTSVVPNFYIYHATLFIVLTAVLFVPIQGMGRSMPLLFASIARDLKNVGQNVGSIYFANTMGCVFGGICGGYLLYFYFNLDQILKIALVMTLVTMVTVAYFQEKGKLRVPALALSFFLFLSVLGVSRWPDKNFIWGTFRERQPQASSYSGPSKFYEEIFRNNTLVYRRDGPTSTINVTEGADKSKSIIVNGKSDGNTNGDRGTVLLVGHLPALLTSASLRNVAVIGFGTGMTAGSLSLYPQVEKIHVFEISPLVQEYAPLFDFANHNLSKNPKVQWHIGDAYRQFFVDPQTYSLIASEPSNPWVVGVERLFSIDFLKMAKSRLERDGIYAQWFHSYDIAPKTLKMVLNTFSKAFAYTRVFYSNGADIVILGSDTAIDRTSIENAMGKWQIPQVKAELESLGLERPVDLLAHEIQLPQDYFSDGGIHSLEFPKLSYDAGYDFFLGASTNLVQLQDRDPERVWRTQFSPNALINLWYKANKSEASLKNLISATCWVSDPKFFQGWQSAPLTCKQVLTRAMLDKVIPGDPNFHDLEISELEHRTPPPITDPTAAEKNLKFLSDYNSIYVSFSIDQVRPPAEVCMKGTTEPYLRCRLQLIKTLSSFGDWKGAKSIMEGLADYQTVIPEREKGSAFEAIVESSRASLIGTKTSSAQLTDSNMNP